MTFKLNINKSYIRIIKYLAHFVKQNLASTVEY